MTQKIRKVLENKKIQSYAIAIAVFALLITCFAVSPWATDGYEDIGSKAQLEQRIATALANNQSQVLIDYSGENYAELKSWLKEEFLYPTLSQYTDEFTIYNYDGAKFTYWTYGEKKRVKIAIQYKLNTEQIAAVNSYVDNLINSNGLRNMSQYEQIKFVHDYLINNFSYNVNQDNVYDMTQNGQTNCYGYTMMNYVILNRLGVEVRTTHGKMNNSHIWNAVKLDGTWYYEDITWDTVTKGTDYFLISTAKLQQSHTILGNFVPDCPADYVAPATTTENNTVATEGNEKTDVEQIDAVDAVISETEQYVLSEEGKAEPIQATEQPAEESFLEDNTNNSSNSATSKTEKIQKLNNLLKTLKTLKNK